MIKCLECKKEFDPKSRMAAYCSNKCRQKNYRKKVSELLREARDGKIVSPKVVKEDGKSKAEIKIELPNKAKNKKSEMSDFWKERMAKKLGIK